MSTEKNAPASECTGRTLNTGNSTSAQRARILSALQEAPVTTFEARKRLDIPHPAGRVMELRKSGYEIATLWTDDVAETGRKHRVARYVLLSPETLAAPHASA
jgi:Helix-turn-helix domain